MKQVKKGIPKNLQRGIPLKVRPGHTVRLEVTDEPLTVHTGLSLFYAMSETLDIPRILDEQVKVKERESGYPESEHILALAANAFIGGDYLDDLEALREDGAIQKAIGRKEIPDPTTAGDFCRRFTLGHILQMNRAFAEIEREVYKRRREKTTAEPSFGLLRRMGPFRSADGRIPGCFRKSGKQTGQASPQRPGAGGEFFLYPPGRGRRSAGLFQL